MSDLLEVDTKVRQGAEWRDYVTHEIDGEEKRLCYRDLFDDENAEVVSIVGREKFEELIEEYSDSISEEDQESVERYQELISKRESEDGLTDDEEAELEELEDEVDMAETAVLDLITPDFVEAMHTAVEFMVCPDDDDVDRVMEMSFAEQEELFGDGNRAKTREQAYDLLKEHIPKRITENSTDYTAFTLGMKLFFRTRNASGN